MASVRGWLTLVAVVPVMVSGARGAAAQPVDPYQQANPPAKSPATAGPATDAPSNAPADPYAEPVAPRQDPQIAERVAQSLVVRAQELLEARSYQDAKQLAVEALVASPRGASSERAHTIIRTANQQLGIPEDAPEPKRPEPKRVEPAAPVVSTVKPTDDVDLSPIGEPPAKPAREPRVDRGNGALAARVHGGLYAGLLGATIGALIDDQDATAAATGAIAGGVAGVVILPRVVDKLGWSESRVRTIGSATVWGGVIGGLFGDVADTEESSGSEILSGASIGATLAGLGGYVLARSHVMTPGDVALVDTLAGAGTLAGVTIGMVMQPPESEAYSVNAALGAAAGVTIGLIAGPRTNTTPRRMLRVATFAALGGGVPLLVYAVSGNDTESTQRITGAVSTLGLFAGGYLGLRLTRNMDVGLDTLDSVDRDNDAPVALVGRSSSGRWAVGSLGVSPLSPQLAPQRGMAIQLVGAAF